MWQFPPVPRANLPKSGSWVYCNRPATNMQRLWMEKTEIGGQLLHLRYKARRDRW